MINRIMNPVIILLTCWGMLILPFPEAIYGDPADARRMVVEVTDAGKLCQEIMALPAMEGWDSDEMQQFLSPIKVQLKDTLNRLKSEFKIDIPALVNLLAGRVKVIITSSQPGDPGGDLPFQELIVFAEPGEAVDIDANIRLARMLLSMERSLTVTGSEESGCQILTITDGNDGVALAYNAKRFVLTAGRNPDIKTRIEEFILADVPVCGTGMDITREFPQLTGEGLLGYDNTELALPPAPDFDLNALVKAINFPGIGETFSRVFVKSGRIMNAAFCVQNTQRGLCSLLTAGSVSDGTLAWAHESASALMALHADVSKLPVVVRTVLGEASPELPGMYEEGLAQIEGMTGINVESSLFAKLGDEILFISYPSDTAGGFPIWTLVGLSGLAAVIKLKDETGFAATADMVAALLTGLAQQDQVGGGLKSLDYKGTKIQYIKAFSGILSPCFVVKDGYLVLTGNVPLMKHILDTRGAGPLTATADFKQTVKECGGDTGALFAYSKPIEDTGSFLSNLTNSVSALGIVAIVAAIMIPSLEKSRRGGRRTACKNNLRQIGLACSMHAMAWDENFPNKLAETFPDTVSDRALFLCPQTRTPYVYLAGLTANSPTNCIVAFDSKGAHQDGRNVLYVDAHVSFEREARFKQALAQMLTPEFKKHYSPEAAQVIKDIIAGKEKVVEPAGAAGPENELAALFDESKWQAFAVQEGTKLGAAIDFALFPRGEIFPGGRKSNYTRMKITDKGLLTESGTGHFLGEGGGGGTSVMIAVAVIAIIAAIAIPSLIKSKVAANEGAASGSLKTFNGMIATFKRKDYDNNGIRDYPTSLAALYYEVNNAQERITLIGRASASADIASGGSYLASYTDLNTGEKKTIPNNFELMPKQGYWFAMIPLMANGQPYAENNRNHYAICAFPADYGSSGENTFIINEEGTVYSMDRGIGEPIEQYPAEDPTTRNWVIAW